MIRYAGKDYYPCFYGDNPQVFLMGIKEAEEKIQEGSAFFSDKNGEIVIQIIPKRIQKVFLPLESATQEVQARILSSLPEDWKTWRFVHVFVGETCLVVWGTKDEKKFQNFIGESESPSGEALRASRKQGMNVVYIVKGEESDESEKLLPPFLR